MADNEEFISEFLIEASENLDQLDQDLVALEKTLMTPTVWRVFFGQFTR